MPPLLDVESNDILVDHTFMVERVITNLRAESGLLTLDDCAEIAGVSPFYFNRIFRSIVGIPPGEFAASLRFERAKDLLLTTPASITEICFEAGYNSLGTFSSRFKKLVGVSPASFRDLPDIVVDMDFNKADFGFRPQVAHAPGTISGSMTFPPDHPASIFIGVYPARIAVDRPIAGKMLTEPGPFELTNVPFGTWQVMSAALPAIVDPIHHLLPKGALMVSAAGPFNLFPGEEHVQVHLNYVRPKPIHAPVLIALPTLILE